MKQSVEQPLRIALLGYGRMGREVEQAALRQGLEIVARIDNESDWNANEALQGADVAIDFSIPATAPANIIRCFERRLPVVVGTTGWYDRLPELKERCLREKQSLFVAANFNIGVHVFMAAARFLAQKINTQTGYTPSIQEIHHIHKLDKPSGTALVLKQHVLPELQGIDDIEIASVREGETIGVHRLDFDSPADTIELTHTAKNRSGLAKGAVQAACWLHGKTGFFGMEDMLGF
ncbi:MAG: 4-hydroxy-tetrahydrodipicolinate reductase [Bacteroides sp.]|nr:4-hydroxy-tetrahydrodipicolinate reductase [Bacteroides sp.]MCM1086232.1 4-hydroxy-tetrahydrodipicolinate reductase [Bacteroides sp.]